MCLEEEAYEIKEDFSFNDLEKEEVQFRTSLEYFTE